MERCNISLSGFKYDLTDYDYKPYDSLGVSNETIHEAAYIKTSGQILVIQTRDDNDYSWVK